MPTPSPLPTITSRPRASPGSWSAFNVDSGGSFNVSVTGGKGVFTASGGDQRGLAIDVGSQTPGEYLLTIDVDSGTSLSSMTVYLANGVSISAVANGNSTGFSATGAGQTKVLNPTANFTHLCVQTSATATVDNFTLQKRTN